jgi:hypothetical protein
MKESEPVEQKARLLPKVESSEHDSSTSDDSDLQSYHLHFRRNFGVTRSWSREAPPFMTFLAFSSIFVNAIFLFAILALHSFHSGCHPNKPAPQSIGTQNLSTLVIDMEV